MLIPYSVIFDDVTEFQAYLECQLTHPTPLKKAAALYFCWTYYHNTFGKTPTYPEQLFKAEFSLEQNKPVETTVQATTVKDGLAYFNDHNAVPTKAPYYNSWDQFKINDAQLFDDELNDIKRFCDRLIRVIDDSFDYQLNQRLQAERPFVYQNPKTDNGKLNLLDDKDGITYHGQDNYQYEYDLSTTNIFAKPIDNHGAKNDVFI